MTTSPTQSTQFSQVQDQNGHIFREVFRRLAPSAKLETFSAGFHAPGQMGEDTHTLLWGRDEVEVSKWFVLLK